MKRGHIAVDILVLHFSKRLRRVLNGINDIICTVFFAMAFWQITQYATTLLRTGEVTETLRVAYYPFTYGVALGCLAISLVFLADFLKTLFPKDGDEK
jgi:TRAP-type C4-dicarboxylate transport system permease small subunit